METISKMTNSQERSQDLFAKDIMMQMRCSLPAIVESVDYTNQTLTAKPVTIMKKTDSNGVLSDFNMPVIVDVPFQCYKGGNFSITVPVNVGDEVLIVFTDVDFSAWFQNGGFNYAEHSFLHSYSNAIAIVGISSEVKAISNYSSNSIEIRCNGTSQTKISLSDGKIELKANSIVLDGETTIEDIKFLEHNHTNGNQGANTGGVVIV